MEIDYLYESQLSIKLNSVQSNSLIKPNRIADKLNNMHHVITCIIVFAILFGIIG